MKAIITNINGNMTLTVRNHDYEVKINDLTYEDNRLIIYFEEIKDNEKE